MDRARVVGMLATLVSPLLLATPLKLCTKIEWYTRLSTPWATMQRLGYAPPRNKTAPEPNYEDPLSCAMRYAKSQNGEDLHLLPTLHQIAGGRPGVFVEIGAYNGIHLSNTYMLERCFNWTGLLIEANPNTYHMLDYVKKKGCRDAQILHSGACAEKGFIRVATGGGVTSGELVQMSAENREKYARRIGNSTAKVPCEPLGSLMDRTGIGRATLLSLDVEGAEAKVLSTVDPGRFDVVLVESDGSNPEKEKSVHRLLTSAGHELVKASFSVPNSLVYIKKRKVDGPTRRERLKAGKRKPQ